MSEFTIAFSVRLEPACAHHSIEGYLAIGLYRVTPGLFHFWVSYPVIKLNDSVDKLAQMRYNRNRRTKDMGGDAYGGKGCD